MAAEPSLEPQASTSKLPEAAAESTSKPTTVAIRLTSRTDKHAIPESKYMVPSDWRRFQLSELINKVLENEQKVPFDFLVGEELLRTSLSGYAKSKGLTEETVLELEYVESILPPKYLSSFQHDDWVSDIDLAHKGSFLTSSYDGNLRIFTSTGLQHTLSGHNLPVLSTAWLSESGSKRVLASGGMDRVIRIWQGEDATSESSLVGTHALALHTAPVSSVRSLPSKKAESGHVKLVSAGWDGLVGYWDVNLGKGSAVGDEEDGDDAEFEQTRHKRRRRADGSTTNGVKITKVKPTLAMHGHTGQVSRALLDAGSNGNKVYSFGLDDHTVKEWDLTVGGHESASKQSDKAIMDADQLANRSLLVTGNADRTVTLFDMREENSIISMTLVGHTSSVSAVSANPQAPLLFCSASYDNTVKIWDARSPKQALFTLQRQKTQNAQAVGKLICTAWDGEMIASGGEDGKLELMESKSL